MPLQFKVFHRTYVVSKILSLTFEQHLLSLLPVLFVDRFSESRHDLLHRSCVLARSLFDYKCAVDHFASRIETWLETLVAWKLWTDLQHSFNTNNMQSSVRFQSGIRPCSKSFAETHSKNVLKQDAKRISGARYTLVSSNSHGAVLALCLPISQCCA